MCFNPKFAYYGYAIETPKNSKEFKLTKKLIFIKKAENDINVLRKDVLIIPCGKCLACIINNSNNWATRCYLESKKWKNNFFITLTIDKEHNTGSLNKKTMQNFFKRLRKDHSKFRYFCCGEYGSPKNTFRPHYHMGAFGLEPFDDMKFWKKSKTGFDIYVSDKLNKIWGLGYCYIQQMTFETAAYIARYTQKKIHRNYDKMCEEKGLVKEFKLTSRKPGIALDITQNTIEWEKIKNNFGVLVNQKGNIKLKGIPQALRKKWRDIDRIEYFEKSDANTDRIKEELKKKIAQTSLTPREYRIQTAKITEERLKRLKRE